MSDKFEALKAKLKPDKTVYKALALGGLLGGGAPCELDCKDGRVVRVRPMRYDRHYSREHINPWKFQRNGKTLEPCFRGLPSPYSLAYKKRTYSPNRIKFPMKRVDWDPNGERNPQNRGKSKFVRISWDEATDLIASEIKRVHKEYGPLAILAQGDGHGECKTIHHTHGQQMRFLEMTGGFTQQVRNPDSWEGFYWGSKHVWGQGLVGMMHPSDNVMKDMTENTDLVLFWGCDPETTPWGFVGQFASRLCYFWADCGIKQVYVCPDLNYGAAVHADKWIPVLPNTDAALELAIIYQWIKEDTYDKEYVATHTVGFDKVKAYVMGEEDGVPKDAEWASPKCGVPEWTIKAFAREIARNTTSFAHYFGGSYARGPYSSEPARLECIMLGMQGLGRPGVHQTQITYGGMPRAAGIRSTRFFNPELSERLAKPCWGTILAWGKQLIPKTLIHKAINKGSVYFWGTGAIEAPVEDQFIRYEYPIAKEDGGTEVHMIWTDTPCRITCWNCGNETIEAMRNPKIECFIAQHPWLENDSLYADIVLPVATTIEIEDMITNTRQGMEINSVVLQKPAIDPIGEARSDYECVLAVAEKMGYGEQFSEGKSIEDLEKEVFHNMELEKVIDWEEFKKKEHYMMPIAKDWEQDTVGLRPFFEDPEKNPLPTPTGKLEFCSTALEKHFPDDPERPPIPKWIDKSNMHDERRDGFRGSIYPLLIMSNHGRWRVHAQGDDISWDREVLTCKVPGFDGYKYEPIWINPKDAAKRNIQTGDICRVFNERGGVLVGAIVWERIREGAVYVDHGSRHDPLIPGYLDRGGAINTIAPSWITSDHCVGQATSGYLVDVERVSLDQMAQWKRDYPEAFEKPYDPDSGLRFDAWVVEGGQK